jgi:hypothetical protein
MYAISYEVPGNRMFYDRVKSELGEDADGLLVHLVVESEGGLRHIGVWNSKQQWETYREERVRPAVNRILAQAGIPEPPAPEEEALEVVDLLARDCSAERLGASYA